MVTTIRENSDKMRARPSLSQFVMSVEPRETFTAVSSSRFVELRSRPSTFALLLLQPYCGLRVLEVPLFSCGALQFTGSGRPMLLRRRKKTREKIHCEKRLPLQLRQILENGKRD